MKEKISYDDLVRRINAGLNGTTLYHDAFGAKPGKPLQEVNAWTYWQGYKVRNPKVMIVGQDWGSLKGSQPYFDAIDDMITSRDLDNEVQAFKYIPETERGGKEFSTDLNLVECLKCMGYEDALHKRYDDLFFGTVQAVKGMEKFFLCRFLSYNKLNIIDKKNIDVSVFFTEFGHC